MAVERSLNRPASWGARLRVAAGTPERAALLALAGLLVLSLAVRLWLARLIATPWIMTDELSYSELAKSLASSGHLLIRGTPTHLASFGYPAAIAPAWWLHPMSTTYLVAKAINVVLATATAVPLFLWARRLVSSWHAVIAVALTLLMPALTYTGMLMTENAFLPAFVLASYAIASALERPTIVLQALAFGAILLATFFRLQGLVLLAVLPLAILLKVVLELQVAARPRPLNFAAVELRRYWLSGALLLGGVALYAFWEVAHGRALSSGLGTYEVVTHGSYSFGHVRHWALLHLEELPVLVGVLPASALLLLLIRGLGRGGTRSDAERAFLAVSAVAIPFVVVEAAAYASRFSLRVEERYMFFLTPLFVLGFVLWLDSGLPRPRIPVLLAAIAPPLLLIPLPLGRLLNVSIYSDTFGLIPFMRLSQAVDGVPWTHRLMVVGAIVAGAFFVLWPRSWFPSLVLPGAVAVFFVLSGYVVTGTLRDFSRSVSNLAGTTGSPSWIDARTGSGQAAAFLFGTTADPWPETQGLWQQEFWNRRLGATYNLSGFDPPGGTETPVAIDPRGGVIVSAATKKPIRSHDVVSSLSYPIDGRIVAVRAPYALFRTDGPVRVTSATTGVYADRWMGSDAGYTRYVSRRPGRLSVRISRRAWNGPDVPGHVLISLRRGGSTRPSETLRWTLHSRGERTFTLRTPTGPFVVTVHIAPTFSPSQFGQGDTRQLGAQVSFDFAPSR